MAYFKELVLEHRLKTVENQYDFSTKGERKLMNEIINSAERKVSAYIHIPFCEHICYYCDFNKVFLEGQPVDEYVEMLLVEM